MTGPQRTLTLREAAQLIYRTPQPTAEQLRRVRQDLEQGCLKGTHRSGGGPVQWLTTTGFVAEYLALRPCDEAAARAAPGDRRAGPYRPGAASLHDPQGGGLYLEVLKEYCAALVFRRSGRPVSPRFRGAVWLGQAALLLLLVAAILAAGGRMAAPLLAGTPAELAAVTAWIETHEGAHQVLQSFPPEANPAGPGVRVRVQYRYAGPQGRWVQTDRVFLVDGAEVIGVDSAD